MKDASIHTSTLPDGTIFQWKVVGKQGSFGCVFGFHDTIKDRETETFIYTRCDRCEQRIVRLKSFLSKEVQPDKMWLANGTFADHIKRRRPEDPPSIKR